MNKSEYRTFFVELEPDNNIAFVKCILCNNSYSIGNVNHKNVSHMKVII